MVERIGWYMAKFSNAEGGPVYIMLHEVAAVTPAKLAGDALLAAAALGARVVLKSGLALYTAESADTVFEEVRRANTTAPPPEPKIRLEGAPGPSDAPAPAAPILATREDLDHPNVHWPARS